MIRKVEATDYPRLMEIWESAVSSTHDFLKEEDFLYYKEQLPVYFQHVTLFGFEQEGILIGFMGIAEGNLEMLFVDDNYRGIGIGKRLRHPKCCVRVKLNPQVQQSQFQALTKAMRKQQIPPFRTRSLRHDALPL